MQPGSHRSPREGVGVVGSYQPVREHRNKCVTHNNLHNLFSMSRSGVGGSFTSRREPTLTRLDIPEKYVKLELRREEVGGSLTCKCEETEIEKCDGPGGFAECVSVGWEGRRGGFTLSFSHSSRSRHSTLPDECCAG